MIAANAQQIVDCMGMQYGKSGVRCHEMFVGRIRGVRAITAVQ
jgi:hypothetical protein